MVYVLVQAFIVPNLHQQLSALPSLRLSFGLYNIEAEIRKAIEGIIALVNIDKRYNHNH